MQKILIFKPKDYIKSRKKVGKSERFNTVDILCKLQSSSEAQLEMWQVISNTTRDGARSSCSCVASFRMAQLSELGGDIPNG